MNGHVSGTGVRSFPGLVNELVLTADEGLDSVRQRSEVPIQQQKGVALQINSRPEQCGHIPMAGPQRPEVQ